MSETLRIARTLALVALVASCLAACGRTGGRIAANSKIVISFSQLVPDQLPLWIAEDQGIFKKNGLNVELRYITGQTGLQTLLSGQTQLASIGAAEGVSAAGQGAKVQYIAALAPVFTFVLYARPDVRNAGALAGQRVGITSATGSVGIATKVALTKLGLNPDRVVLSPLGQVQNVNTALVRGAIKAAVSHPPGSLAFQSKGIRPLLDMVAEHVPYDDVALVGTSSFLKSNRAIAQKVVNSLTEAAQVERSDQATSLRVLKARIKLTDDKIATQTYDFYRKVLPATLRPDVGQLKTAQDVLGQKDPKVRALNLNQLVDTSFVTR